MDAYSTSTLIGVIQSLIRPVSALLDKYFPTVVTFDTEAVDVDVVPGKRRLAPLVSPMVEGKVIESLGQRVNTIKPAYVKAKIPFNASRAIKRAVGERIGGGISGQARMDLALASDLEDLIGMVIRRKEVMASEALRLGKITLAGEKYPTTVVDFGRAAGNTIADLLLTARWPDAASKPLRNLEAWSQVGLQASGANLVDVIMGTEAWTEFKEHASVEKRLLAINQAGTALDRIAQTSEGLVYKGTIDGFNIYVYAGWYIDPDSGVLTEIWPAKAVGLTSELIEGQQLHGAILDPRAGLQGLEFFPKQWYDEDPAALWTMVQSAPLVAPLRPDATVYCNNVIDA